jgi:hypothetical protein
VQIFEGADAELIEAIRLYGLVERAVRSWRFPGVPSRLIARAEAHVADAAHRIEHAKPRATPADVSRIDRLRRTCARLRDRLDAVVERRATALRISPKYATTGAVLDLIVELGLPDPRTWARGRRWRVFVALSSLLFCSLWCCCSGCTWWPWVLSAMMSPGFGLAWLAAAAAFILPAFLCPGPARAVLTLAVTGAIAAVLVRYATPVPLSMLPFGVAVLAWLATSWRRHAS